MIGLALIAMGEDLGSDMAHRALEHALRYGELPVRCLAPSSHCLNCLIR